MQSLHTLILPLAILLLASMVVDSAPNKDQRLKLQVIRHQPCTSSPTVSERIRFPKITEAPLVEDLVDRGPGCYSINGPVRVSKSISSTIQIYTQLKLGIKSPPEPCQNADATSGCGGIGSCVYCDVCSEKEKLERRSSGQVEFKSISSGGKSSAFNCRSGLKAATYDDLRVSFCTPTKSELLRTQNIDEEFWNKNAGDGQMFFLTIYVFDREINKLAKTDVEKMANVDNEHVIGCHKIVGRIYESDEDDDDQ